MDPLISRPDVGPASDAAVNPFRAVVLLLTLTGLIYLAVYYDLYMGNSLFTRDAIIWYGSFHYYIDSLVSGHFPYWDPYMMTGTYFYPTISLLGLLDPAVLICAVILKMSSLSPLTIYVYFHTFRLVICAVGAYYLFEHVTKSKVGAALSACVLFFSLSASYCVTDGPVLPFFLTPFALFFLLKFFDTIRTGSRYLYLAALALVTGISMNVYIPAYYLFNLVFFAIGLVLLRIVSVGEVVRSFHDRKLAAFTAAAACVVLLMTAPPLAVMFRDASGGGELFPIVRIIQKNDGKVKQIMASEISSEAVSGKFTNQQGVFCSYGNMLSIIYPDIFESVPFFANDLLAEIPLYIGVVPFLLALIGLLYHKSRLRFAALFMLLLTTVNMFSFDGMSGKPFNALQRVFNAVFPPLKMIEVRELFAPFFVLYMCLLMAMGLSLFLDAGGFKDLAKRSYRRIAGVCLFVVFFKAVVTGYYAGSIISASVMDLFVLLQFSFFALCIYLYARDYMRREVLFAVMLLVIFSDQYVYARFNAKYTLGDGTMYRSVVEAGPTGARESEFQYFREPLPSPPGVAFGESILKRKGVLTFGNNHTIFSTKRYYDVLTHVPLQNQLALGGVFRPIMKFFPVDKVMFADSKKRVFDYITTAREDELADTLIIEDNRFAKATSAGELGHLNSYNDVEWLTIQNLAYFNVNFYRRYGAMMSSILQNLTRYLNSPESSLAVKEFSANDVTVSAANVQAGYLLYNDGWSKYWRAYVDGKESPVLIANYNSKAVYLGPGSHTVKFVFDPVHYRIGLALYYAGLAVSVVLIGIAYRRAGKSSAPGPGADR